MNRRTFLVRSSCASIIGGFFWGHDVEPFWIELTHTTIPILPAGSAPITLAHLSDFHLSKETALSVISRAIGIALAQKPDLVCITGDFISRHLQQKNEYQALLSKVAASVPTFATLGNHDGGKWVSGYGGYSDTILVRSLIEDSGIKLLHNSSCDAAFQNTHLRFVGLGDLWAAEMNAEQAFSKSAGTPAQVTILLSHNPDSKEFLGGYSWDLMLSGHTHGGQLIIPFIGSAPLAPVRDHRYVAGLNGWGDRLVFTNRGIGSINGIRLNCRPEVSILKLAAKA